MPEMHFDVRWPDGSRQRCYSPSHVIEDFLESGATYRLEDFVHRTTTALALASERVRAKYGMACTSAAAQSDEIVRQAERYDGASAEVTVERVTSARPARTRRAA